MRNILIPILAARGPGSGAHAGAHLQLKASAQAWLETLGCDDARLEVSSRTGGLVFDVASLERRVIVECGRTDPYKLVRVAKDGAGAIWLPHRADGSYEVGEMAPALLVCCPAEWANARRAPRRDPATMRALARAAEEAREAACLEDVLGGRALTFL